VKALEAEVGVEFEFAPSRLRTRRRLPFTIIASFGFIAMVVLFALVGGLFQPYDPGEQDLVLGISTPSSEHLLGTDDLGRDMLSRTIEGARTALVGPLLIAFGAMIIGSVFGILAGYRGGLVDSTIMRVVDLMFSLPALLIAIVVVGVIGGGYFLVVALLTVLMAPGDVRLIRGATLEQRPSAYVEAAETMGLSQRTIMRSQIWPVIAPIIVANSFLVFAFALVAMSGLSFLGIGVGPGTPDWGRMLYENRLLIFDNPAAALAPAAMIVGLAVSMNLVGDWVFETLSERGRRG
jgi:peptide/nickel transport system permease protein